MIQGVLQEGVWKGRGEGRGAKSHPEAAGEVQVKEDEACPGWEQKVWTDGTGRQKPEAP